MKSNMIIPGDLSFQIMYLHKRLMCVVIQLKIIENQFLIDNPDEGYLRHVPCTNGLVDNKCKKIVGPLRGYVIKAKIENSFKDYFMKRIDKSNLMNELGLLLPRIKESLKANKCLLRKKNVGSSFWKQRENIAIEVGKLLNEFVELLEKAILVLEKGYNAPVNHSYLSNSKLINLKNYTINNYLSRIVEDPVLQFSRVV